MQYEFSSDWTTKAREIAEALGFSHIKSERIVCIKSRGTSTRRTIARIHGLPKILQISAQLKPLYTIELISERFDKLSDAEKTKTLIHELMHIPHNFGGGFRHHRPFVTHQKVEEVYAKYLNSVGQPQEF